VARASTSTRAVRTQATASQNKAALAGVTAVGTSLAAAQGAHAAATEAFQVAATYNLESSQVFGAVFISLIAGILATKLGAELYK